MLFTFFVASPEKENFDLTLQIESSSTFADLQRLLHDSLGWEETKSAAFYLCGERWIRERAVGGRHADDSMDDVELGDLIEDEGQRLQYVFDTDTDRLLVMRLTEIVFRQHIDKPTCLRRRGEAPTLESPEDEEEEPEPTPVAQHNEPTDWDEDDDEREEDEDFEGFDPEEFDPEGFEIEG